MPTAQDVSSGGGDQPLHLRPVGGPQGQHQHTICQVCPDAGPRPQHSGGERPAGGCWAREPLNTSTHYDPCFVFLV